MQAMLHRQGKKQTHCTQPSLWLWSSQSIDSLSYPKTSERHGVPLIAKSFTSRLKQPL
jgi:hypothetical protein